MQKLLLAFMLFAITGSVVAQKKSNQHRVVIQLSSEDTLVHKSLMKQLSNILTAAPDTKIEVVCHEPGINILTIYKTIIQDKIRQMKKMGVVFLACENTLKERNIAKENIIPEAGFVPSALVEIITKQEAGWSYIKSGF
jgi:intracellular sulfur oxidation DsrE/DsrF family protein